MNIKRKYIITVVLIVLLSTGIWLIQILLDGLKPYGFIGYLSLLLFIISLSWTILYEFDFKSKRKLAKEIAEKVISEQKAGTSIFDGDLKADLYNHLINKAYNEETYTFFKKAKKGLVSNKSNKNDQ